MKRQPYSQSMLLRQTAPYVRRNIMVLNARASLQDGQPHSYNTVIEAGGTFTTDPAHSLSSPKRSVAKHAIIDEVLPSRCGWLSGNVCCVPALHLLPESIHNFQTNESLPTSW